MMSQAGLILLGVAAAAVIAALFGAIAWTMQQTYRLAVQMAQNTSELEDHDRRIHQLETTNA